MSEETGAQNRMDAQPEQKQPIKSDVQWANQKQEIKNMFTNKSMRELAARDFEYGLSREDIMLYADKQHLPLGSVEQLSRALKVHDGRELVNYLRDSGLNAYQMELEEREQCQRKPCIRAYERSYGWTQDCC